MYLATAGETWDIVAFKIWGNEKLCHLLMESNPQYLHKDVFEGGEELTVPQLPETQGTPPAPWREE